MSFLEQQFIGLWQHYYPDLLLIAQYSPARPRLFKIDFADPTRKIGIEIQGGIWKKRGGHSGGTGITSDAEKFTFLAAIGWRMMPLVDKHLRIDSPQLALIAHTLRHSPIVSGTSDAELMTVMGFKNTNTIVDCREKLLTPLSSARFNSDQKRLLKYWQLSSCNMNWQLVSR